MLCTSSHASSFQRHETTAHDLFLAQENKASVSLPHLHPHRESALDSGLPTGSHMPFVNTMKRLICGREGVGGTMGGLPKLRGPRSLDVVDFGMAVATTATAGLAF